MVNYKCAFSQSEYGEIFRMNNNTSFFTNVFYAQLAFTEV